MNLTFLVISNKLKIRMTLFSHLQKGLSIPVFTQIFPFLESHRFGKFSHVTHLYIIIQYSRPTTTSLFRGTSEQPTPPSLAPYDSHHKFWRVVVTPPPIQD